MSKKLTTIEFIERSTLLHNHKYDYSLVDYTRNLDVVTIICPIHGKFSQKASTHLLGIGCKQCGVDKRRYVRAPTTEEFVKRAKFIHCDKYDYSLVKYKNSHTKIEIICKKCNTVFLQTPYSHMDLHGCPKCNLGSLTGWSKSEWVRMCDSRDSDPLVYIIRCFNKNENFIKIGSTSRTIRKRFSNRQSLPYSYEVIKEINGSPDFVYDKERELHKKFRECKYIPLIIFRGQTECFNISILQDILKHNEY